MLKVSFLGGLGDFGKNMTVYEQDGRILVVDCGSMFPEADNPGIDLIIPDFTCLRDRVDRIAGLVLTHGHEDHIGAVPFFLRDFSVPVFATPLTMGFIEKKLSELGVDDIQKTVLEAGRSYRIGPFAVEGIPVTHSVPDAVSLIIDTPDGRVLHTGDFKLDQSPLDGRLTHYHRFHESGRDGVMALLIDSTNVEVEGMVGSESRVRKTLERYISAQSSKLFITLFSTNLMRLQTIFDLASRHGRKVALFGRSLVQNAKVGVDVGYLRIPKDTQITPEEVPRHPRGNVIVLTSGSQAEPFSALNRVAFDESKHLFIEEGDLLILSSRIIPGNEKRVARLINQVYRKGGEVITAREDRVHVSGHGAREEIRLIASWVQPEYYIPVHGEYRQLKGNAQLALDMGFAKDKVIVSGTGETLKFENGTFLGREEVPAGSVLIDGDTSDSVDRLVVRDRRHLSNDGIVVPIVVINRQSTRMESEPEIISRGYPYLDGGNGTADEVRKDLAALLRTLPAEEIRDSSILKAKVKSTVKKTLKRNEAKIPLIIPVVMEI